MKHVIIILFTLWCSGLNAQTDSLKKWTYSGYGEFYFSYDFSNPANHEKPNFLYNHKRHNELGINLFIVNAAYDNKRERANLGLMAGHYAQYNLGSEPTWAQFISEANLGYKLSDKKNIWIDLGILPSHIGFESAVSADCWTLTRSLLAENSPYYESGLRVSYTSTNEKLYLAGLLLNGWQRVRKPDFIQHPSFGLQATFKPSSKLTLNYSNFIGTDIPDSIRSFRHFHNFYLLFEPSNQFGITAGFDIGFERVWTHPFNTWYTPVIIVKKRSGKKTILAFRAEYYSDAKAVIITTQTVNGFQTLGLSTNFDLEINRRLKWRIEGKMLHAKGNIFKNNTEENNFSITTNMTFKL